MVNQENSSGQDNNSENKKKILSLSCKEEFIFNLKKRDVLDYYKKEIKNIKLENKRTIERAKEELKNIRANCKKQLEQTKGNLKRKKEEQKYPNATYEKYIADAKDNFGNQYEYIIENTEEYHKKRSEDIAKETKELKEKGFSDDLIKSCLKSKYGKLK